jgi:hypothetical protein
LAAGGRVALIDRALLRVLLLRILLLLRRILLLRVLLLRILLLRILLRKDGRSRHCSRHRQNCHPIESHFLVPPFVPVTLFGHSR